MDFQCSTYDASSPFLRWVPGNAPVVSPAPVRFRQHLSATSTPTAEYRYNNTMKQSSKRLVSVLFSFLFVVAAFVCFFDLVQPAYNDVETLRSKQLGEESYLASEMTLVKQAQTAISAYESESQGASSVGLAMPSGEDVAGALAQIQGIAANNDITIGNIAVTPPALQLQESGRCSGRFIEPHETAWEFHAQAYGIGELRKL